MKETSILYEVKNLEKIIFRNLLTNSKVDNDTIKKTNLTMTQLEIINYIINHEDENIYQKDLEKILNLRRATVSGVLQTMEKNHLLERVIDDKDTRVKKIILNEKTKNIFTRNNEIMKELETKIIKNINKEDLEVFLKVLKTMKENIKLCEEE